MKKTLSIIGLSALVAAGLLAAYSQPARAQQGQQKRACAAMVVQYEPIYSPQGYPILGFQVSAVSPSPGCPDVKPGDHLGATIATLDEAGLKMLPQVAYGILFFQTK